jgi:hypothetical protein
MELNQGAVRAPSPRTTNGPASRHLWRSTAHRPRWSLVAAVHGRHLFSNKIGAAAPDSFDPGVMRAILRCAYLLRRCLQAAYPTFTICAQRLAYQQWAVSERKRLCHTMRHGRCQSQPAFALPPRRRVVSMRCARFEPPDPSTCLTATLAEDSPSAHCVQQGEAARGCVPGRAASRRAAG